MDTGVGGDGTRPKRYTVHGTRSSSPSAGLTSGEFPVLRRGSSPVVHSSEGLESSPRVTFRVV